MANIDLKNPAFQKLALSIVAACGLMGVFFFTHLLPFCFPNEQETVKALEATFQKKSTDLARARTTVADLPRFEAEYGQLHEQWILAAELLPTDKDLPTLLRKISLSGQQTGVTFMTFRPNAPRAEAYYSEMPVTVSVQGGYHQVGSFLAELANLRRIVTVSSVKLTAAGKGADDPTLTTSAEFTASAYSLNTTPVAPPAADNKKKSDANHSGDSHAH
jgi:type IV pilus assembly protein PilO